MSDNIPFGIQMKIIKKVLDVKSLIRFRSISKSWKSFIDSPEFIAGYNARLSQPHRLILRYIEVDSFEEKYVSFLDDNGTFTQQHDSPPTVSDLIKQLGIFSEIVGSSHGLWCLYGNTNDDSGNKMVVLWNPSLRKSVGIVDYDFNRSPFKTTVFGFGVCPVTCDPTVVKISYLDRYDNMDGIHWHVAFFTLSSKRWETIPSRNLPRRSIRLKSSNQVVVIGRFIYWAAYDRIVADDGRSHNKHMIMSFDLITKAFKLVDIPDSIISQFLAGFTISKLRESLILFGYTKENEMPNDKVCGVWMMVHDGVTTSFRRIYTIETPNSSVNEILGFTKSGEPVIETRKRDSEIATFDVYEPRSQHITNFGIYGEYRTFFMSSCMESLLLLDHPDCSIY